MLSIPFLLAAMALAFTPGPGMAYVVARTAAGGRGKGLASCAGTAAGGMLHVLAAAAAEPQHFGDRANGPDCRAGRAPQSTRARWLARGSGVTMIGLGTYQALARRDA